MNQTIELFDSKKCLHHLFEEAVTLYPEHTALIYENKSWSYSELNSYVNRVAHYLISEKGIQPDNLVGVCLDRSEDMVVAMLAVLKAGAAYIPIDPEYPFARVEYMVKDAQPICVMTTQSICQKLPFLHSYAVCFDDELFQKTLSCKLASNISLPHLSANNLAYVIYTSGSTGKPKGVMVEHGNIVNFLYSMKIKPGIKQQDTLLAVTSTSFDIHTLEIFLPLISGAKIIVADRNSVMDPNKLIALMDNHNVNLMQATPATWKMLLDVKWNPVTKIKVLCGGEALSSKLAGQLLSNSNIELWNMYGPTETTVWSLLQKIEEYGSISIGAPIANTQIYIVDHNLHVCPVGVVGELLIGGLGVARGYLNRPELTAEKFIPDHFLGKGFLYKTGDMVRYSSRGILEYIGRKDYQVKIRGFRIELEEIENALLSCNNLNVKDVLVIVKPITLQLVAFIVPVEGNFDNSQETQIIEQLRSHINSLLPSYMMPSSFVFIDEFPLTPNGKVDRNKLIEFNVIENESEYVEAETDIEKSIQKIWQDILNIEKISVSSDFFHLGGDSLLAIKFIILAAECGMPYSVQQVFESRTIKRLAASGFNKSIAEYKEYNGPVKLTVEQKHLLSRNLLPERFVIPFHVVTKIDKEILLQSLEFIINYHETLRLSFAKENGIWVSVLREPKQNFSIIEIESAEFITYEMEGWLDEKMFQLMSEFNIESGPLIKVYIFRSPGSEDAVLSILIHHLVADGVSAQKIVADLLSVYQQISAGSVPALLPKEISYKDTIDSLYRYAKSPAVISEKDYWLSLPWDAVGQIPLDYQYAEEANTYGSTYRVALSLTKDDTSVLSQELARKFEIPLHVALISAMASALGKLTQKQYIRFASVNARGVLNKALAGFDVTRITGWLSTKSHIVICNNDNLTSIDKLHDVKNQIDSIPGSGLGFQLLQLASEDDVLSEIFSKYENTDVIFNYIGQNENPLSRKFVENNVFGEKCEHDIRNTAKRETKLMFMISIVNGNLLLDLQYSKNLHQKETVYKVAMDLISELKAIISDVEKINVHDINKLQEIE